MQGYLSPSHVDIVILTASDVLTNLLNLTALHVHSILASLGVQTFCSLMNGGNTFREFLFLHFWFNSQKWKPHKNFYLYSILGSYFIWMALDANLQETDFISNNISPQSLCFKNMTWLSINGIPQGNLVHPVEEPKLVKS